MERKYDEFVSKAIQERARTFLSDPRVGSKKAVPTILQVNQETISDLIRTQNRRRGITDYQLDHIRGICRVYDSIVGLNQSYTPEFLEKVSEYLNLGHEVIDSFPTKNRSFIGKRSIARSRRNDVLKGEEYFWHIHLYQTQDLIEQICKSRNGVNESELDHHDPRFYEKIKTGEYNSEGLSELLDEGRNLFYRTFVNCNTH